MPAGTLQRSTLTLLERRLQNSTYFEIYSATGLKPDWLRFFKSGRMKNPNVDSVQKLYEFLSGRALAV